MVGTYKLCDRDSVRQEFVYRFPESSMHFWINNYSTYICISQTHQL